MKLIITSITLLLFTLGVLAQDNDIALLKKNNVAVVYKKLYVHAFGTEKDTCLFNLRKFNILGEIEYEKVDLMCMGWPTNEEMYFEHKNGKTASIATTRDGLKYSHISFTYEESKSESPVQIKTIFFQTNDSSLVSNQYFYNKKNILDSTVTVNLQQDGSIIKSKTRAIYNKKGEVVQLFTLDENEEPTEMVSNEIDDNGLVLSVAYATYGEKPNFTQTYYTYDQKGRISSSYNTTNQKQEIFYLENGLLSNILNYNPKGELEAEYIFEYTYRE